VVADALSWRYALISVLGAKLLRLQSILAYYLEESAFQELVSNILTQGPYVMQDGFLFKGNKLCILACPLRELLVRKAYEGSLARQFRMNKTLDILKEHFHWPRIGEDVHRMACICSSCHKARASSIRVFTHPFLSH